MNLTSIESDADVSSLKATIKRLFIVVRDISPVNKGASATLSNVTLWTEEME